MGEGQEREEVSEQEEGESSDWDVKINKLMENKTTNKRQTSPVSQSRPERRCSVGLGTCL